MNIKVNVSLKKEFATSYEEDHELKQTMMGKV
jgi:hypothetical protein